MQNPTTVINQLLSYPRKIFFPDVINTRLAVRESLLTNSLHLNSNKANIATAIIYNRYKESEQDEMSNYQSNNSREIDKNNNVSIRSTVRHIFHESGSDWSRDILVLLSSLKGGPLVSIFLKI